MSNENSESLFMDPSWQDPNLGGLGPGGGSRGGMGGGGSPRPAQSRSPSVQSSAAADPFSQLSLSRGQSGEAGKTWCNNAFGMMQGASDSNTCHVK